jgi:hypothetical protein
VGLYLNSKVHELELRLDNMRMLVPVALVLAEALNEVFPDECYGATTGGMFFVSWLVPSEYRSYTVFHSLAEHAAPRGLDVTGLAKHYQALALELGYAKCTLSPADYLAFASWRKSVERSKFFALRHDRLIGRISQRMRDIFRALPQQLTFRRAKLVKWTEEAPL